MSSNLVQSFRDYYKSQENNLYQSILQFDDFEDYREISHECFRLKQEANRNFISSQLLTNGSTGDPKSYSFSDFEFWRPRIEGHLRDYKGLTVIHIYDRPFFPRHSLLVDENDGNRMFTMSLSDSDQVDDLFNRLDKEDGSITIVSSPNVWLHITSSPILRRRFNAHAKIKQGVNADWDKVGLFEHLRFPVKDQMIDWYTGLNFFTCSSGEKHILPLFCQIDGKCQNLLNLAVKEPHRCDDLFEIQQWVRCNCGRVRPILHFRPHHKSHLPVNHELIRQLRDTYINLQFFLIENRIHVYRMCQGPIRDTSLIAATFKDCVFHEDSVARVGAKAYNFWNPANSLWSVENFKKVPLMFL